MTGHLDRIPWHTCRHCGKRSYSSRRAAKAALRHHGDRKGMAAYECHTNPGVFHLGHIPTAVRRGHASRDNIALPRKRDTA